MQTVFTNTVQWPVFEANEQPAQTAKTTDGDSCQDMKRKEEKTTER